MKKISDGRKISRFVFIISLLIFSLILNLSAVDALTPRGSSTPEMLVTLLSQEPDPVEPGETLTLKFKIENNGTATLETVKTEFLDQFPFKLYSGERIIEIGKLRAMQTGADSAIVEYKIKVDETAVEGEELIELRLLVDGVWRVIEDIPIEIRTRDLVLSIEDIKASPQIVSPGDDFSLDITLGNNADSLIRNVKAKLNLTGSAPFAPSRSGSEGYVYQINSKTQKTVSFNLVAMPEAEGGIYKVPITLSYTDESGNAREKSEIVSLKVSSQPELLFLVENSEITKDQKSGTVSIRIVNKGLTDIKLVTAKLEETEDFVVLSELYAYVGNIDTDDYETAEFNLNVRSYDKIIDVPLMLEYRDITNKKHQEEFVLKLHTGSSGLILTVLGGMTKLIFTLAILIGIGYGGYWLYLRRKAIRRRKG